jgi:hypothetical protein
MSSYQNEQALKVTKGDRGVASAEAQCGGMPTGRVQIAKSATLLTAGTETPFMNKEWN